jgi:3-hydroxybutyrate dehydrogenase
MERYHAINLSSVFHTSRLALPGMRARNWGRIINIASVHGLVASKEKSAYVAAKHGVVGLTKTLALETASTGVTCNAICPGWVLTPLVQQQIDKRIAEGSDPQQAREQLLAEKQPSGEFVTPQQLGELALFLCSEGAARCAARHGTWTAAGSRNNRPPAQEAPAPSEQRRRTAFFQRNISCRRFIFAKRQ